MHPVRPALEAVPATSHAPTPVPSSIRDRFPALADPAVVYLDSAATTQKPDTVIAAVTAYHARQTANAGRGTYGWATSLAARIEAIRGRAAAFVGARHPDEIVFTAGATAALGAIAHSWGLATLDDGDEILYNPADHAANVLPWHHLRDTMARFGRRIVGGAQPRPRGGAGGQGPKHPPGGPPPPRVTPPPHANRVGGG
ncbi:aminotransferase class V-fold PLP-dependent enzyme, partial [Nocardia neocaledoniensis]|uniref:aminotransferase class V-fold PLP-dependent enzyme n=1 Tax=Nocardia neocaledoniensis TaxID=236511 RepID=UPI0024582A1D